MKQTKYLFKNISFLTLGQFGTKLLNFFLVPLYTSILSTADYGTFDFYTTTVGLLIPLGTLNIADAALRFPMDSRYDKRSVFSVCIRYLLIGLGIAGVISCINLFVWNDNPLRSYPLLFVLLFFVTALNGIILNFSKALDKVASIAFSGFLSTAVMVGLNVLFLVFLKWGLSGYFWANIIGILFQDIYLLCSIKAWNYLGQKEKFDATKKEMREYSIPLMANTLAWWVNSLSDRYIVTWFVGIAENGIYSVGYKIPSILSVFQSIFNQAWTLSAVKDFDSEDRDTFFSSMYNGYNCCMVLLCSFLIVLTKFCAKVLYAADFYAAWRYVPFLLISVVFGSMAGFVGGVFTAVKDSKIFAKSTIIGAVSNLILNILLVRQIGAIGAAIATSVSYLIVWIMRIRHSRQYILLDIHKVRDGIGYAILVIQALVMLFVTEYVLLYSVEIALFLVLLVIYRDYILKLYHKRKGLNE